MPGRRTVVVIRHAHAGDGALTLLADHARALDGRGRREATRAGKWLAEQWRDMDRPPIDLVLVSDAVRARQTWDLISAELSDPPPATIEPRIYNCGPDVLLDLLTEDRARVPVVAVVGHNPAVSQLARFLSADEGPGLVPAAIAVIEAGTAGGVSPGDLADGHSPSL
jgi:phosphohistidine phosphatase